MVFTCYVACHPKASIYHINFNCFWIKLWNCFRISDHVDILECHIAGSCLDRDEMSQRRVSELWWHLAIDTFRSFLSPCIGSSWLSVWSADVFYLVLLGLSYCWWFAWNSFLMRKVHFVIERAMFCSLSLNRSPCLQFTYRLCYKLQSAIVLP